MTAARDFAAPAGHFEGVKRPKNPESNLFDNGIETEENRFLTTLRFGKTA